MRTSVGSGNRRGAARDAGPAVGLFPRRRPSRAALGTALGISLLTAGAWSSAVRARALELPEPASGTVLPPANELIPPIELAFASDQDTPAEASAPIAESTPSPDTAPEAAASEPAAPKPDEPALAEEKPAAAAPAGEEKPAGSAPSPAAEVPPAPVAEASPVPASEASSTPAPVGKFGLDVIHGNGGILYNLSHGGIVPESLSVRANGRPMLSGQDFLLNAPSGHLSFLQPIDVGAVLHVRYRYQPDQDRSGSPFSYAYLPSFVSGMKLNLLYSTSPGSMSLNSDSSQVLGFSIDPMKLGFADASGMMLLSRKGNSPFDALRRAKDGRSSLLSQLMPSDSKSSTVSDELMQYSLDNIKVGKGSFGLSYRKVGKDFDFAPIASQFASGPKKDLFDRLQKERGLSTLGFAGNYAFGGGTTSKLGFTRVSDDNGSATQQLFSMTGKKFEFNYRSLSIASGFAKLKEADLQGADKMKPGQELSEMALNLRPSSRLALQGNVTRLKNEKGDLQSVRKTSLEYTAGKQTKVSLAQQQAVTRLAQGADNTKQEIRQSLALNHQTRGGIVLQASQDMLKIAQGGETRVQRSSLFHIETAPNKPTMFLFDRRIDGAQIGIVKSSRKVGFSTKIARFASVQWTDNYFEIQEKEKLRIAYERKLRMETDSKKPYSLLVDRQEEKKEDGATKALQQIVFAAQVSPNLSLKETVFSQETNASEVSGNNLEFAAKPTPKIEVNGNMMNRQTTEQGAADELNLNLKAAAGSMDIVAHHQRNQAEKADQDRKETALEVAAPISEGSTVRGSYLTTRNKGKRERLLHRLGFERGLLGGKFIFEMGKTRYVQGHPFTTYAMGYASNQDPKMPLRLTVLQRKMGANDGAEVGEHQFSVDYRLSPRFTISAKSFQNNSVKDGFLYRITPVRGNGFTLDWQILAGLKLATGLNNETNMKDGKVLRTKNLTLKGKLNALTDIDLTYLSFIAATWKEETPTHWVKLNVQRELSEEDRFVLTGEAKFWKDSDDKTKDKGFVNARLDYVKAF